MKFTFSVFDKITEDRTKFVVKMAPSEVEWHIALKLLGYIMFYEHRPQIEQDVGQHYRPDLFVMDEFDQKVALWIDCGHIAVKKIDKVATKMGKTGQFYILRRTESDAVRLRDNIQKIKHPDRVNIIAFDPGFVDQVAELLSQTNEIEFNFFGRTNGETGESTQMLWFKMNGTIMSSAVISVAGEYTRCTS